MIDSIVFAVLVIVAVLVLPVVRRSADPHAWHKMVVAHVPFDSVIEASGQSPRGVRAQELGELRLQNAVGCALASPLLLIDFAGVSILATVVAAAIVALTYKVRAFDDAGHGAEILVAESEGREGYRAQEIRRMLGDSRRAGLSAEDMERRLRRLRWLSQLIRVLAL